MKATKLAIALPLTLAIALSACGEDKKEQATTPAPQKEETMEKTAEKTVAAVKESAEKVVEEVKEVAKEATEEVQNTANEAVNTVTAVTEDAIEEVVALLPGDAANGEKIAKKCKACHTFEEGGKHKTGPNLFGVIGRKAGTVTEFEKKYSDGIKALDLVWNEELVSEYLENTTGFLKEKTGDPSARSKMTFKLKDPQDRKDVAAYLATLK